MSKLIFLEERKLYLSEYREWKFHSNKRRVIYIFEYKKERVEIVLYHEVLTIII